MTEAEIRKSMTVLENAFRVDEPSPGAAAALSGVVTQALVDLNRIANAMDHIARHWHDAKGVLR